jgi:hypothetical protein
MIKLKFDSTIADAIIPKLRDTPGWLMKMMADITFRKMLIELHDQNRNSTLIKVALKEICKMGHHRCSTTAAHLIPIELIAHPTRHNGITSGASFYTITLSSSSPSLLYHLFSLLVSSSLPSLSQGNRPCDQRP